MIDENTNCLILRLGKRFGQTHFKERQINEQETHEKGLGTDSQKKNAN